MGAQALKDGASRLGVLVQGEVVGVRVGWMDVLC